MTDPKYGGFWDEVFAQDQHKHDDPWRGAPPWAHELRGMMIKVINNQQLLAKQTEKVRMALKTIDEAIADAAAEDTVVDSMISWTRDLLAQIDELKTNQTDPATAEKIDALATAIEARTAKLVAAISTPAVPGDQPVVNPL